MKLISVIVPVYKSEKYLKRCIESIINQTYKELEVILVDDGSPDDSGKICDEYAKKDVRIKVIHKENGGVSIARNSGLDIAMGHYITFVDSDDYIEPEMYQKMMQKAEQYNCDIVMCDCVKEYEDSKEVYSHDIRAGYYNRQQIELEYFPNLLIMPNVEYPPTISNWLCLFRRKLESGRMCPRYLAGIRFSEDLLYGAELMYYANSFYYMKNDCFYHYCMNPESASHTFRVDKWSDYMQLHQRISDIFSESDIYDFSKQIDLVLLFFVYNAVGDIIASDQLEQRTKLDMVKEILNQYSVRNMFQRLRIKKIPIPFKQKIVTWIYKYQIGLKIWINRGYR